MDITRVKLKGKDTRSLETQMRADSKAKVAVDDVTLWAWRGFSDSLEIRRLARGPCVRNT